MWIALALNQKIRHVWAINARVHHGNLENTGFTTALILHRHMHRDNSPVFLIESYRSRDFKSHYNKIGPAFARHRTTGQIANLDKA